MGGLAAALLLQQDTKHHRQSSSSDAGEAGCPKHGDHIWLDREEEALYAVALGVAAATSTIMCSQNVAPDLRMTELSVAAQSLKSKATVQRFPVFFP